MAGELLTISHLIKTIVVLAILCAAAALLIVYVLPRVRRSQFSDSSDFGLKIIASKRIDQNITLIKFEDENGGRFVFSSSAGGLNYLGRFDDDGSFLGKH